MSFNEQKILENIGNRIRKERIKCGLSQSQLAYEVGVSLRQIQRIESGQVRFGIIYLHRIADVLNTDCKSLL